MKKLTHSQHAKKIINKALRSYGEQYGAPQYISIEDIKYEFPYLHPLFSIPETIGKKITIIFGKEGISVSKLIKNK